MWPSGKFWYPCLEVDVVVGAGVLRGVYLPPITATAPSASSSARAIFCVIAASFSVRALSQCPMKDGATLTRAASTMACSAPWSVAGVVVDGVMACALTHLTVSDHVLGL